MPIMNDQKMKQEFLEDRLSIIMRHYIETALKKRESMFEQWGVVAIDPVKDRVIFSRFIEVNKNEN